MKNFTLAVIAMMGLTTGTALTVLADSQPPPVATHSSGNQLMQGYTPWYQKAATNVGPVDKTGKGGLVLQPDSYLYMEGDSTLHKYQMHANALLGSAVLKNSKGDLAKVLKANGVASMVDRKSVV